MLISTPSARPADRAPSARLLPSGAHIAPTHPSAPPEQRGGVLWPQEPASGRPKVRGLPSCHPQVRAYLSEHLRGLCHRYGPYCGGGAEEARTPVAAVHVRHGDACDRRVETPGPWNNMFAWDEKLGKLTREAAGGRRCYSWAVYRQQLLELQRLYAADSSSALTASTAAAVTASTALTASSAVTTLNRYGVRTVLLSTDDHTGGVLKGLQREKGFNWVCLAHPPPAPAPAPAPAPSPSTRTRTRTRTRTLPLTRTRTLTLTLTPRQVYLDYPREQFRKRAWMEFRSDLDENAPFSLAAGARSALARLIFLAASAAATAITCPAPRPPCPAPPPPCPAPRAELELLGEADLFVGNMGSHTSRLIYLKLVAAAKTAVLPPFISVDGYGLCCGRLNKAAPTHLSAQPEQLGSVPCGFRSPPQAAPRLRILRFPPPPPGAAASPRSAPSRSSSGAPARFAAASTRTASPPAASSSSTIVDDLL